MISLHGFDTFVERLDTSVQIATSRKLLRDQTKVPVPQVLDPMVFIGDLVKALNLYSNSGVGNHSQVNKNSNVRGASKRFWMQKTRPN